MGKTILTSIQTSILKILAKESSFIKNFYFTGDTVLAEYYLHHRYSEDLDFFSDKEVDGIWLVSLGKKIKNETGAKNWTYRKVSTGIWPILATQEKHLKQNLPTFRFHRLENPGLSIR